MEYFNKDNQAEFYKILKSWDRTPYLHMGELKGRGADCTKFIGLVLVEFGILTQLEPRVYYAKDWPIHGNKEIVFASIENHFEQYAIDGVSYQLLDGDQEPIFGDILCFTTCRSGLSNHTAFATSEGMMYHCSTNIGVIETQILENWKKRLKRIYRLYRNDN